MIELRGFTPRDYQQEILKICLENNTLVVLPTGIGKTFIALLLACERLKRYPDSKVLITAPTKPLCSQHVQTFKQHTNMADEIALFTGATHAEKRKGMFDNARIIIATPQTIQSDLKNGRISLKDFSMVCMDEAHRSRMNYANTSIAKHYVENSPYSRILALTASPGSNKERIEEICRNLFIDVVEIRTEADDKVKAHIKEKEVEWVYVDLDKRLDEISSMLKIPYKRMLDRLANFGVTKPVSLINTRDLLDMQKRFSAQIRRGNRNAYFGASLTAFLIKLDYAKTLLETQSPASFLKYMEKKLEKDAAKAAKALLKDVDVQKAIRKAREAELTHPKMEKLIEIVSKEVSNNPGTRIIIFANYRVMVDEIIKHLKKLENARPIKLIGQKEGLSQKEQVNIIRQFEEGTFNILVGTSISEEGLNLRGADLAVFYDSTASEIRNIQRKGRVGRFEAGRIVMLITRKTKDEAFRWASHRKEKRMHSILKRMKDKQEKQLKLE